MRDLVEGWADTRRPLSRHTRLEVAASIHRGAPLAPGEPVPGCACPTCTGLGADDPARQLTLRPQTAALPPLDVEGARAVPITEVAARLGIEHRRGWARCPFHDDSDPSFHLNDRKGAAFCNVCGKAWDGIALVEEYRGVSFPEAVRELTGRAP